jgi:hypothetical protein
MTAPTLLLDPVVYRAALRRVAFGQIVFDGQGRPQHHSDVLVPHVLAALTTLQRHEFIGTGNGQPARAVLTMTGTQLLDWLNRQQTDPGVELLPKPATRASEVVQRGPSS